MFDWLLWQQITPNFFIPQVYKMMPITHTLTCPIQHPWHWSCNDHPPHILPLHPATISSWHWHYSNVQLRPTICKLVSSLKIWFAGLPTIPVTHQQARPPWIMNANTSNTSTFVFEIMAHQPILCKVKVLFLLDSQKMHILDGSWHMNLNSSPAFCTLCPPLP